MPYDAITFTALKGALAERLGDPQRVFWTDVELGRIVVEALRTYNVLTSTWRTRVSFTAVTGQMFYDLPTIAPAARGQTVTDRDLVTALQDNLLEPATPTGWTGTEQFTLEALVSAIQRRRNQWLLETGMVVTERLISGPARPGTRFALPANLIDVRRVGWIEGNGRETVLSREDAYSLKAFAGPSWNLGPTITPLGYSVGTVPPLQMQIAPEPQQGGRIRLLAIETPPDLNPIFNVSLRLPNDWTWAIRFGALADLLTQAGPAQDIPRGTYCQQRWAQAVKTAQGWGCDLTAQVDDQQVSVQSIAEADAYDRGWNNVPGRPAAALVAGANLFALSPVADNNLTRAPYGVSLDVLQNAPVPSADGQFVQIAAETIDPLLDYGVHLAAFKMGGAEFASTQALLESFYRVCGIEVAHESAASPNRDMLVAASSRDEAQVERVS